MLRQARLHKRELESFKKFAVDDLTAITTKGQHTSATHTIHAYMPAKSKLNQKKSVIPMRQQQPSFI
jgi:hypothetical protein